MNESPKQAFPDFDKLRAKTRPLIYNTQATTTVWVPSNATLTLLFITQDSLVTESLQITLFVR